MPKKNIIVYVVGHHGPEHNDVISLHRTHAGAFKAWNKVRLELLATAKRFAKDDKHLDDMWTDMVKKLSCKDPKKIDNYPHETPYIWEQEVEE